MPLLGQAVLVALVALVALPLSRGQLVTQLFSDDACKNLISVPIPRPTNTCVSDLFSGTFYKVTPADGTNTAFVVGIGCSSSACSDCATFPAALGECRKYGTSSIRVERALVNRQVNASLLEANCTAFASGYGSATLESGVCTAGSSNGIVVTLVEVGQQPTPDVIFSLACSTDCASCGFYGRGKPDECITLPLPDIFGQVNLISGAASFGISIGLLLLAVAVLLL